MYRRSRSPEYRSRRYSPSRPLSRSPSPPARRYDPQDAPPGRAPYNDRRYSPPPPRRYSPSPPRRRFDDYPPPPGRVDQWIPPPRRRSLSPPHRREYEYERVRSRSPIPPPRARDWDAPAETSKRRRGMASDQMDIDLQQGRGATGEQWERGRDIAEIQAAAFDMPTERRGRQPAQGSSDPSRNLIFLGLDPELTEQEFMGFLINELQAEVESVKIVYDKNTGKSKCFGFANFPTIESAEGFVNENYPAILMPALYAHSEPRKVKIDFSTPPNADGPGGPPVYHAKPGSDGMRDIGPPSGGNRVLLLRGLNFHSTGEDIIRRVSQEIARMLGKPGREKEAERAICRVALVVDRESGSKWGFAFVEVATAELATALMPFLISPESQPNGFVIADFLIAASFTNPDAFIAIETGLLGSSHLVRASRSGGFGSATFAGPEGKWVGYWHEQSALTESAPKNALRIEDNGELEKLPIELRAFLGSLAGPAPGQDFAQSGTSHPTTAPTAAMGPVSISMAAMQPIKLGAKGKMMEEAMIAPPKGLLHDDEEEKDFVDQDSVLLSRTKGVANIIGPSSRKIAKNISKWNTKKTELKAPAAAAASSSKTPALSAANATLGANARQMGVSKDPSTSRPQSPATPVDDFDFSDITTLASTGKVACLLCQRQFKTVDVLKKHNAQSDLHKTNLVDSTVREAGVRRKNATLSTASDLPKSAAAHPTTEEWGTGSGAAYRDRAAERRIAHHQPDRPSQAEIASLASSSRKKFDAPKRSPPPVVAPMVEVGKDESNVGNQLLAKMGWKEGTGLGLSGDGRVEPIKVQQFESRVGLGKTQGRDPAAWDGPGGFARRALDMAKERYHSGDK